MHWNSMGTHTLAVVFFNCKKNQSSQGADSNLSGQYLLAIDRDPSFRIKVRIGVSVGVSVFSV